MDHLPTRSSESVVGRMTPGHTSRITVQPGDGEIFNYAESLHRLGGDRDLFTDILGIFLEDAPKVLREAGASLADGDCGTLERAAHTLKGLSATFGAEGAVSAAYAVELHARERKLDKAAVCFPQLQSEMERLQQALREFRQP